MPDNTDGSIVALKPKATDPVTSASSEPAHITLAWLGSAADLSEEDVAALREEVISYFAQVDDVITASVVGRETLGADEADVVMVDGDGLRALRDGLVALPKVAELMGRVEQYPEWTPHVTLGYPDSPANDPDYAGETIEFDKASLWIGTKQEDMTFEVDEEAPMDDEPEVEEAEDEPTDEEMAAGLEEMGDEPIPWHGVLAPLGVESGDMRVFDSGSLTWRDLPIPFKWQKFDNEGHDTSVVVGNITNIWEEDGLLKAEGFFASNAEAAEVISLRAEDMMRGVSVDVDMATSEFATRSGIAITAETTEVPPDDDPIIQHVTSGRVASSTIVAIPAFQEAWFDLGTWADEQDMQDAMEGEPEPTTASMRLQGDEYCMAGCGVKAAMLVDVSEKVSVAFCAEHGQAALDGNPNDLIPDEGKEFISSLTASGSVAQFAPGTKDGPGWITHPKPTARIRRYWTRGKGAAKIRWGAPGDFNRCRKQLVKYVQNPEWLAGTCANMHKEALGIWPGQHTAGGENTMTASAEMAPSMTLVDSPEAIVAAATTKPAEWFEDPQLTGPTPMTITESGQVYGHAATWNECHIGIQNKCVTAPHSIAGYAYFHTGEVLTDKGPVAVGNITMGTGHAGLDMAAGPAAAHYDDTGTVIADVRMGEDKYGIWFSGAVRSTATEEQLTSLRAAAISGDWRPIGAGLEMVAALVVNVPGFPVPRTAVAASGAEAKFTALVAAAPVLHTQMQVEEFDAKTFARQVIAEMRAEDARQERRAAIAASLGKDNRNRREALLTRMDGGE